MNKLENLNKISTKQLIEKCTGCFACSNICPQNIIEFQYNKEGFLYPIIVNEEECINCSKCLKACKIISNKKNENNFIEIFDIFSKNEKIVQQGSSGGFFPEIANIFLKEGYIIYGAIFDEKTKVVYHTSTKINKIEKIYKSKYVQSRIGSILREIKLDLDKGEKVLFTGTPCQVLGLKKYLNKDYRNLITFDFICHGVPSPKVFQKYLECYEKKFKKRIVDCTFREKEQGWRSQIIKLYFDDGEVKKIKSKYSKYYNLFIFNYILRKSCYSCFNVNNHYSDITLSDSWNSTLNSNGVSRIILNTIKGKEIFKEYQSKFIYQEIKTQEKPENKRKYSLKNRKFFYKYYKENDSNNILFEISRLRCFIERIVGKLFKNRKN